MHLTESGLVAVWAAIAALAFFNVFVSVRILACDGLSGRQKAFQLAITWLLPLLGATVVYSIVLARSPRPKDPGFDPVEHDSSPIGS